MSMFYSWSKGPVYPGYRGHVGLYRKVHSGKVKNAYKRPVLYQPPAKERFDRDRSVFRYSSSTGRLERFQPSDDDVGPSDLEDASSLDKATGFCDPEAPSSSGHIDKDGAKEKDPSSSGVGARSSSGRHDKDGAKAKDPSSSGAGTRVSSGRHDKDGAKAKDPSSSGAGARVSSGRHDKDGAKGKNPSLSGVGARSYSGRVGARGKVPSSSGPALHRDEDNANLRQTPQPISADELRKIKQVRKRGSINCVYWPDEVCYV